MKLRQTVVSGLTLALIAATSTTASAQQRGRGGFGFGGGGGGGLVTVAASEPVQKDLGLSGDVSGKLRELRDDYLAAVRKEYETGGVSFQGFQDMSREQREKMTAKMTEINRKLSEEFNPKVKNLVAADQYKRIQQIQLQSNLRFGGPGALTYSEVATELKLSEEQKSKLNELSGEYGRRSRDLGGEASTESRAKLREEFMAKANEVLNADQKTALEKLKGPEFDVSQLGFGGGRGRRGKN
jgi:hypothetical protein